MFVHEVYIKKVYIWLVTECVYVYVKICEIWLKWFQKKVDKHKDNKTYFHHVYEYLLGWFKLQLTGVLS